MESRAAEISRIIKENDNFLVASHFNPDGDALGSTAAMGYILTALGKNFTLYNETGAPAQLAWVNLPGALTAELPEVLPEWIITLDCGTNERLGQALDERRSESRVINIDHHLGNPMFGDENWVDTDQPAVGTMMAELAEAAGVELEGPLAENVYLAVATDTGFFTYGNTTPESMELAAKLLRNGLDMARMNMLITKQGTLERMKLWVEVVNTVQEFHDGKVALVWVTDEMFQRTGTTKADTENIINYVRRLKELRVAAILREEGENEYKFSLRSYGDDNVQEVAAEFGGGGHRNASGGTIHAPLESAKEQLVNAIAARLELS